VHYLVGIVVAAVDVHVNYCYYNITTCVVAIIVFRKGLAQTTWVSRIANQHHLVDIVVDIVDIHIHVDCHRSSHYYCKSVPIGTHCC
jgi:hypothetical protein